ncbi:MAG: NRDE family protein [Deltaproteobacteria bacterium]|nr:NRDE family protein [Deltaproteobacteria bacterium]
MCIILFALDTHPEYRLILASNRDEYFDRPTAPAASWEDAPDLLAGRDLKEGGTWLGITKDGRFGALTNYRDPATLRKDAPSRGGLVTDFLLSDAPAADFLEELRIRDRGYNGYNLLLGDNRDLYWYSNRGDKPERLSPGIYALSNRLLDTPWPKAVRGKKAFEETIRGGKRPPPEDLFDVLSDRTSAPDEALPHTGVAPEWERVLSPIFISSPQYGTRASTLLFLDRNGKVIFMERTFGPGGECLISREFAFRIRISRNG